MSFQTIILSITFCSNSAVCQFFKAKKRRTLLVTNLAVGVESMLRHQKRLSHSQPSSLDTICPSPHKLRTHIASPLSLCSANITSHLPSSFGLVRSLPHSTQNFGRVPLYSNPQSRQTFICRHSTLFFLFGGQSLSSVSKTRFPIRSSSLNIPQYPHSASSSAFVVPQSQSQVMLQPSSSPRQRLGI